jgi:hypothetical protein
MHAGKVVAGNQKDRGGWRGGSRRIAVWVGAAFLLLLPAVAMQFTDEVKWDETDFIVFAAMLIAACGTHELAARITSNAAYRAAVGVAVAAAFMLVWINLAVGIIGSEDNRANLMYGGVLAVPIIGAIVARFQAIGMVRALAATAIAQAVVGAIALTAGLGSAAPNFPGGRRVPDRVLRWAVALVGLAVSESCVNAIPYERSDIARPIGHTFAWGTIGATWACGVNCFRPWMRQGRGALVVHAGSKSCETRVGGVGSPQLLPGSR